MKLFYKDVSQIPPSLINEYEKVDGGFALKLEDHETHPLFQAADAKVSEFRNTNIGLNKQVTDLTVKATSAETKLKAFGEATPETITELKATIEGFGKKGLKKPEDVDEKSAAQLKPLQDQIAEIAKKLETSENNLKQRDEALAVSNRKTALTEVANKVGIRPEALPDFLGRAERVFRTDLQAFEGDAPILKDGKPVTPEMYASDLRQSAPHLFKASGGGGTPANAGGSGKKMITRQEAESGKFITELAKGEVQVQADA